MNISWITAKITESPIRFANFNQYSTELHINFLHLKNYFARAIAISDGILGQTIFDIYRRGDYVIIEGESLVIEDNLQNSILIIYIMDIHPAHLIMK